MWQKTGFFDRKLFRLNQIFILQHCQDSWRRIKAACHACAQLTSYRTAFRRKNNEQAVSQQLALPSSFGLLSDSIQLWFFLVNERLRFFVQHYCVYGIGQESYFMQFSFKIGFRDSILLHNRQISCALTKAQRLGRTLRVLLQLIRQ